MVASKFFALGKLFVVLVVTGVLGAAVLLPYFGGVGLVARSESDRFLDTKCTLNETANDQTSTLYASDGKTQIAKFFSQNRTFVPLAQINHNVRQALIDTEDRRFYSHHGVDPRGILRAALNESGETQGASTLTQQYVKQVRQFQAKTDAEYEAAGAQTPDRKIYEAKCALDLEKKYTKNQILEKYLNIAFFGQQSYGIAVAAKNYFNTTPAKLSIPQAALLVGIVKSPTAYNPFINDNQKASIQRRNEVIQNMVTAKDITQAQADAFMKQPIGIRSKDTSDVAAQGCAFANSKILNVGFFCDYLVNWLATKGGISAETLQKGGLKIVSTLDVGQQNYTQQQTWNFPANIGTAVMMPQVDPTTGQILAMATSKYYDYGQQHPNDPKYTTVPLFSTAASGSGSTFKYFSTVAALTAGMQPTTGLNAGAPYVPKNCPNADPSNPTRNAGSYRSYLSLRDALVQSSNTFFVGLEDQFFGCNLGTIVDTARSLGVSMSQQQRDQIVSENQYNVTLGQTSVSPLDLTVAYGVAAADGRLSPPNPIRSITDANGKAVAYTKPKASHPMSPWVARTIVNMMIGDTTVDGGTATSQFGSFYNAIGSDGHLVASKTGTNNASENGVDNDQNAALWFVGLTPRLVAATAIYDPKSPTSTINLPDLGTGTGDTFGAYGAGKVWIPALQPYLANTSWQWPSADQIEGAQQVPVFDIRGKSETDAQAAITQAGFKPVKYPIDCGSAGGVSGTVAWAGPGYATPGQAVYYCMNSGNPLYQPPPPPATKPTGPTTGPTANPPGGSPPGGGGRGTNPPRRGR